MHNIVLLFWNFIMKFKMTSLHTKKCMCTEKWKFLSCLAGRDEILLECICAQAAVRLVWVNPWEAPTTGAHYYCRRQVLFEVEGELKVQHVIKLHSSIHWPWALTHHLRKFPINPFHPAARAQVWRLWGMRTVGLGFHWESSRKVGDEDAILSALSPLPGQVINV